MPGIAKYSLNFLFAMSVMCIHDTCLAASFLLIEILFCWFDFFSVNVFIGWMLCSCEHEPSSGCMVVVCEDDSSFCFEQDMQIMIDATVMVEMTAVDNLSFMILLSFVI